VRDTGELVRHRRLAGLLPPSTEVLQVLQRRSLRVIDRLDRSLYRLAFGRSRSSLYRRELEPSDGLFLGRRLSLYRLGLRASLYRLGGR